jgi:hypothetical protein
MTHVKHSGVWFELPWKSFQCKTFQLQKRIEFIKQVETMN